MGKRVSSFNASDAATGCSWAWPANSTPLQQRLLVITDGRLKDIAGLPLLECPGLLVDIERGPIRLGRARELAVGLQLDYRHIDD